MDKVSPTAQTYMLLTPNSRTVHSVGPGFRGEVEYTDEVKFWDVSTFTSRKEWEKAVESATARHGANAIRAGVFTPATVSLSISLPG